MVMVVGDAAVYVDIMQSWLVLSWRALSLSLSSTLSSSFPTTFSFSLSLSLTLSHSLSFSLTFSHFLSLSLTFSHFLSLSLTLSRYLGRFFLIYYRVHTENFLSPQITRLKLFHIQQLPHGMYSSLVFTTIPIHFV